MKGNAASDRHQNNNLKAIIAFAEFIGSETTFYWISTEDQVTKFLDMKIRPSSKYIGVKEDLDSWKAELNSWKACSKQWSSSLSKSALTSPGVNPTSSDITYLLNVTKVAEGHVTLDGGGEECMDPCNMGIWNCGWDKKLVKELQTSLSVWIV